MKTLRRLARHPLVRQQGKFFTVGLICTVVDFGVFNSLAFWVLDLDKVVANTFSFLVSGTVSFTMNRLWTFELQGKVDWMREAVPFLVVSSVGLVLQNIAIWAAGRYLSTGILIINGAKIAGVGVIWLLKFYIYRKYVFVDRRPGQGLLEDGEEQSELSRV
jgi:putative flippase GtrA